MIIGDLPVFSKMWLSKSEFPSNVKKIPITSGPYTISDYSIGKYIFTKEIKITGHRIFPLEDICIISIGL